ncbi:MAG: hypothetical protein JWO43_270, partial [Candidatus Adlerbacteria bacterium]|nr:hypothetical protein [Candidatus Adlerbacteria bacterium]
AGAMSVLIALSPIWLPIFLGKYLIIVWVEYVRYIFWFQQKHVLLEITLPPEVQKSPESMEVFLAALYNNGGEATFLSRVWEGKFRPVWTLEIASNEGRIAYYLHLRAAFKTVTEARLFGQFPGVQIKEVDDYAAKIPFNIQDYGMWGAEFTKSSPHALPIKTYTDYKLDENPDKPENSVDPITHVLELMSTMGKDEYMWLQFIIKARKRDEWYGFYSYKKDAFKDGAEKAIQDTIAAATKRIEGLVSDETEKKKLASRGTTLLNKAEQKRVENIERSVNKQIFEVGMRGMYFAKMDKFTGATIPSLVNIFAPFRVLDATREFNNLYVTRGQAVFDYPWQDFMNIRQDREKQRLFFRYKHRAYFYVPYNQVPTFMTSEELATLWHFPSSVVQTPGLQRVASRVSEAPSNLPQ